MDSILSSIWTTISYVGPFLVVLGLVVFVHEFGHFWIARRAGVKIEGFSIGFGPEIVGWHDKLGTRWRLAWIPFGGYVKMFGDADPSSFGPSEEVKTMTEAEKKMAFYAQPVRKRFAIVLAGPAFNYLFGAFVLALLFAFNGQPYTSTKIASVVDASPAAKVGMKEGDTVLSIDGKPMESFEQIKRLIMLSDGQPVSLVYQREGTDITVNVTPEIQTITDRFGGEHKQGVLGIVSKDRAYRDLGVGASILEAFLEVGRITGDTMKGLGQMIMGTRSAEELGGPLRIAEMSGKVAKDGLSAFFWFVAMISVNLGLINLFPIPLLDGGHLFFYIVESLRGRPLGDRVQEYGLRFGAAVVLFLMVFATWNDLVHLHVVSYIRGLFS
ncbi:MAG: RIP metalloprotease RseP [Alphaproteobacteria bacterium]|jgi:regulator of sigma E protease|nr:RIP metalloprotease RseP [Alphaproteobacteria bacterium]